jgi:lysophospholipase L1-like esterase
MMNRNLSHLPVTRHSIILLALAAALAAFAWGYLAGTENVFPHDQIKALGRRISSPATPPPLAGSFRTSAWREKVSFFNTFGAQAKVVMIGDSITDGAEWGELFPGASVANRGIDGDTTEGVLERMEGIVSVHAKKAFIMIGINDFAAGRSVDDVFADYRRIIDVLTTNGATVFVQSTLLCNKNLAEWISCREIIGNIRLLNSRLASLASGNVVFVDLNTGLADDNGLKQALSYDGVHLNGNGYLIWKNAIARFVPQY